MSHVVVIDFKVDDRDALIRACSVLHLDFRTGQTTFRTWESEHANTPSRCDDAIGIPNDKRAYEIGVIHKDGCYELQTDFFNGGCGMEAVVGEDAWKLRQEYSTQVTMKQYELDGYSVTRQNQENGEVYLEAYR